MQINRYFLFFVMLFSAYQCYCRNINDVLRDHPELEVTSYGVLDLRDMDIDSLEGLENIRQISETKLIYLYDNQLTQLNDGAFLMMPKLRYIDLRGNHLTAVGRNLFATKNIRVDISYNQLSQEQLDHLSAQLRPSAFWRCVEPIVDYTEGVVSLSNLEVPDAPTSTLKGLMRDFTLISIGWGVKLGIYGALKLALSYPRFAKANFALDAVCHGANIADFIIRLCKRRSHAGLQFTGSALVSVKGKPPAISISDCLNCLENGVHLYNMIKSPATVSGHIRSRTSLNLASLTTNRLAWVASWLPFLKIVPLVPRSIQDSMMVPWSLCPSKYYKFGERARGLSVLNAVTVLPILHRVGLFVNRRMKAGSVTAEHQVIAPAAVKR